MLILTRKTDQEIKINSDISVKVLSISDNQVKIGIEAPKDVQIYRAEIFEKIKQSTIEASISSEIKPEAIASLKVNKLKKDDSTE